MLLNGKEFAKLKYEFSGFMALLLDFGKPITLSKIHFDIEGTSNPGLSAFEVY